MLPRAQEESAIDQGISVEDEHLLLTQDALHPGPALAGQGRQDEASCVVVAVIALVLHLQQVWGVSAVTLNLAGTHS